MDYRKLWHRIVQSYEHLILLQLLKNLEYPKFAYEIVTSPNLALTLNATQTFGCMQNDFLSPMRKPRRKRFRSTQKSSKRNSVGKSKLVTARPNQTRPRECRLLIAIFQRRWHLVNLKNHKQEANVPEILLQPSTHQMLLLLLRPQ